jgi:hypothetical protein
VDWLHRRYCKITRYDEEEDKRTSSAASAACSARRCSNIRERLRKSAPFTPLKAGFDAAISSDLLGSAGLNGRACCSCRCASAARARRAVLALSAASCFAVRFPVAAAAVRPATIFRVASGTFGLKVRSSLAAWASLRSRASFSDLDLCSSEIRSCSLGSLLPVSMDRHVALQSQSRDDRNSGAKYRSSANVAQGRGERREGP